MNPTPCLAQGTLAALLSLLPAAAHAQLQLTPKTIPLFATAAEARDILTTGDDFVEGLSPFDRQARLKTDQEVSEKQFLDFVAQNVRDWSDAERAKIETAVAAIQPRLAPLNLPLPEKIYLLRTTGNEEGGAFYTRGAALVFPTGRLATSGDTELQKIICHELFHVLSRANPTLRDALYKTIGFEKCREVALPAELRDRKITNPDAPRNDHFIRLKIEGETRPAIPILYSKTPAYDRARGGEFFEYLEFRFMAIELKGDAPKPATGADGQPILAEPTAVAGFFEQVGRNTSYIIHPEEILADNFAMLVLGSPNPKTPEVLKKFEAALKKTAQDAP